MFPARRSNPLAYPARVNPGFDPNHIATQGASGLIQHFSVVATPGGGGGFVLLTHPNLAPTLSGAPTSVIDGNVGPCAKYATTGNLNYPGPGTAAPSQIVLAAIVTNIISTSNGNVVGYNSSTPTGGWLLQIQTKVVTIWNSGSGGVATSSITLNTSTPYFLALSAKTGAQNWLVRNLLTGQIQTATSATTLNNSQAFNTFSAGGTTQGNFSADASIAAAYMGYNAFLGLPELQQWALAPWDFWYPPTASSLMYSIFKTVSGAAPPAIAALANPRVIFLKPKRLFYK
jgi:hypothetical protein